MARAALKIPITFTTDVNASAYGEYMIGQGQAVRSLVYFTIGTGIGGGVIQDNHFIGGMSHLEMGHTMVIPMSGDNSRVSVHIIKIGALKAWLRDPQLRLELANRGNN